mmetsp:Transcript_22839/g.28020  ORF Transcript_22839/g.28020 Transcript_22839/m.28020 type:complete len:926 (+) Transcript_22839:115-2892(+)
MPSNGRNAKTRSRILPSSTADVQAALAAVRARTAKLKLQSPENVKIVEQKRASKPRNSKTEQRGPVAEPRKTSNNQNRNVTKSKELDPDTLNSVSQFLRGVNKSTTLDPNQQQNHYLSVKTDINKCDSDSDDDSFDLPPGMNVEHLQNIDQMINKVQAGNAKKATNYDDSDDDSDDLPTGMNFAHLQNIHDMINKVQNSDAKASISKPTDNAAIKSTLSDISSDDSNAELENNVSKMTQVNLAAYIDSLNTGNDANEPVDPQESSIITNPVKVLNGPNVINNLNYRNRAPSETAIRLKTSAIPSSPMKSIKTQNKQQNEPEIAPVDIEATHKKESQHKEAELNVAKISKEPTYDTIKLTSFIEKAREIPSKKSPTIAEVEYLIIYARRDSIPIKPILDILNEGCKEKSRGYTHLPLSPTQGIFNAIATRSSEEDDLELNEDLMDTFVSGKQQDPKTEEKVKKSISIAHAKIHIFVSYITEAVSIIERNAQSYDVNEDLVQKARDDDVDDMLLREILNNPQKHIKYVEAVEEVNFVKLDESEFRKNEITEEKGFSEKKVSSDLDQNEKSPLSFKTPVRFNEDVVFLGEEGIETEDSKNRSIGELDCFSQNLIATATTTPDKGDFFRTSSTDTNSPMKKIDSNEVYLKLKIDQLQRANTYIDAGKKGKALDIGQDDHGRKTVSIVRLRAFDPVSTTRRILRRKVFKDFPSIMPLKSYRWKYTPEERGLGASGYKRINVKAFNDAINVNGEVAEYDDINWEERDVDQYFMHDVDITRNADWFGSIHSQRINDKIIDPVAQPKSVSIADVVTFPNKWEEEWYTTWLTRKKNPNKAKVDRRKESKRSRKSKKKKSKKSRRHRDYDDDSYQSERKIEEDTNDLQHLQIGEIYTHRFRLGERVSRVHPYFVSYLGKSRWKKKYFPRGIFSSG